MNLRMLMMAAPIAVLIGTLSPPAQATTWYVNGAIGSDSNTGLTDTAGSNGPWATISHATSVVTTAGDVVEVEPGMYKESVLIVHGGSTNHYITYKAAKRGAAKIVYPHFWNNGAGAWVNASWIHIDGFTITPAPNPNPAAGQKFPNDYAGDFQRGIMASCPQSKSPAWYRAPSHSWFSHNTVYGCGGSGITAGGDYSLIEYNTVYGCCHTSPYGESGIDVVGQECAGYDNTNTSPPTPVQTDFGTGIHTIIRYNTSYDNMEIPVEGGGTVTGDTDGEGIIIDSDAFTRSEAAAAGSWNPAHPFPYPAQTLVEDNLCYGNGGRGIHVFNSDNVEVIDNTCYANNTDLCQLNPKYAHFPPVDPSGELSLQASADSSTHETGIATGCIFANNIAVANSAINPGDTGILWFDGGTASNCKWVDNLTYDVNKPASQSIAGNPQYLAELKASASNNLLGINPRFVTTGSNFQLKSASPAINSGTNAYGLPSTDLAGNPRVVGGAVDLGAYEYRGTTYAIPALSSIGPSSATEGSSRIALTATGVGYKPTSQILWNNVALTTTHVSPTRLAATVPASDLEYAGSQSVRVFTPTGGISKPQAFTIGSTDSAQFNFESGVQGWTTNGDKITIASGSAKAYAGLHSLAVNFSNIGASDWPAVTVASRLPPVGTTVTFHVWIPSDMPLNMCQVVVTTSAGDGSYRDAGRLTAGAWNTRTVAVPSNAGNVTGLAVQWNTTAAFTGAVYIDSIRW